tara:strand:- start:8074 stop:9381 length:1308 start_codon:yes stop_codon:yes gene_type:complete
MSQIYFLINYISEINNFDIPEEFTLFTIDTSNCNLRTDIYLYKFYIIDNDFLSKKDQEFLIDLYILCKMVKNSIQKLTKNFKKKKIIQSEITTDLYFNELSLLPKNHIVNLIQNNTYYSFRLSDLVNMWMKNLKNTDNLFCKPTELKNPYTNVPFKKHNLYNIFISLVYSPFIIPNLIYEFIKCYCCISKFIMHQYPVLKDNAIHIFVNSAHTFDLMEQINNMMHEHRRSIEYIYFPDTISYSKKKRVVRNMRYIVKNYLYGKYGCNPLKKQEAYDKCKKELIEFIKDNPFNFTNHLIPRTPSIPPPLPPTTNESIFNRINRRNSTLTRTPNISFSLPDSFAQSNEYVPITIENIIENITNQIQDNNTILEEEEIIEENNNIVTETPYRHVVQPYSLQFQAFRPSRELPRTPPNNNINNNNNNNNNTPPFSFRLF